MWVDMGGQIWVDMDNPLDMWVDIFCNIMTTIDQNTHCDNVGDFSQCEGIDALWLKTFCMRRPLQSFTYGSGERNQMSAQIKVNNGRQVSKLFNNMPRTEWEILNSSNKLIICPMSLRLYKTVNCCQRDLDLPYIAMRCCTSL